MCNISTATAFTGHGRINNTCSCWNCEWMSFPQPKGNCSNCLFCYIYITKALNPQVWLDKTCKCAKMPFLDCCSSKCMVVALRDKNIFCLIKQKHIKSCVDKAKRMKKSSHIKYPVFYYSSFSYSKNSIVCRCVLSDVLPCFGAAVILPSETEGGSFLEVSEPMDASPATSFWPSMLGGQSDSSFWISVIAAHLTFEWQTSVGSRGPASSHTESIGSPTRHNINIAHINVQQCICSSIVVDWWQLTAIFTLFVCVLYARDLSDSPYIKKYNTEINIFSPSPCSFGTSPLDMNLLIFFRIFLWDLEGWNFSAWHLDGGHTGRNLIRTTSFYI